MPKMVYTKKFKAGKEISRMGECGRNAYIIEYRIVEVSVTRHGQKVFIAELSDGEVFGEMSMIDDAPRSATVTATCEAEVVAIQRSRFQRPLKACLRHQH